MKLYYTPRSHFSRKVRLLLDGWGATVEQIDVGNVGDTTAFADNPLMKVPVLLDGTTQVLDSDHIAAYLVRTIDPDDRFDVTSHDVGTLNARAVMNGIMAAEVELILAQRSGIDTAGLPRFNKLQDTLQTGLRWLEDRADVFPPSPSYLGFHLVALWDHLDLYGGRPASELPELQARVRTLSALPNVRRSAPT